MMGSSPRGMKMPPLSLSSLLTVATQSPEGQGLGGVTYTLLGTAKQALHAH
jgi:hypothetical protein